MRTLLIVSLVLLTVSAPPLVLMGREMAVDATVRGRYSAERIITSEQGMEGGALRSQIGDHRVDLVDDQPLVPHEPFKTDDDIATGSVSVLVDSQVVSAPVRATIRVKMKDANRYWGFVYLMRVFDRKGADRLVVAQNLGHRQYRTVSVFADGRVIEDQFGYDARCSPPVRALLIRYVVGHPSGYCSDLLQVWPSVVYPLLYPWASGAVGLLGALAWLRQRWSRRVRR